MNLTSRTRPRAVAAALGALVVVAALPAAATANAASPAQKTASNVRDVCGTPKTGYARCYAEIRTDIHGGLGVRGAAAAKVGAGHAALALPAGYGPADLASAYKLPTTGGKNQIVAVVDAGDDATAEADLAIYRSTYGLPACTMANGCFHKVNEQGAASPLPQDEGWGVEIALDLDMVSASCPACQIMLVEGNQPTFADLATSVDSAARLGATEISNSYGGPEQNGIQSIEASYSHPGVAVVASSGDSGYGIPSSPAVFPTVIAAGGTSLTKATNARGWTETAWFGAGSGCSAWIDKPAWQTDENCPGRMVADISADADPNTGPAVYDANPNDGAPGWIVVGGTSASSPFLAGVIALAGNPGAYPNASAFYTPSAASGLNDVVGGNNSEILDCGGDYQCNAVAGYDGPTGNGTPNGLSAF